MGVGQPLIQPAYFSQSHLSKSVYSMPAFSAAYLFLLAKIKTNLRVSLHLTEQRKSHTGVNEMLKPNRGKKNALNYKNQAGALERHTNTKDKQLLNACSLPVYL